MPGKAGSAKRSAGASGLRGLRTFLLERTWTTNRPVGQREHPSRAKPCVESTALTRWAVVVAAATLAPPAFAVDVDCMGAKNDHVVYVRVEKADVLAEPKPEAARLASLSLGSFTCAVVSEEEGDADWVFVREDRAYWMKSTIEPIQGWIPRSAVAYSKDLRRLTQIRAQKVIVEIGDYHAEYDVRQGGTFSVDQVVGEHRCRKKEIPNEHGACEDWGVIRGDIVGTGILAMAVSKQPRGSRDVFKLRADGVLCAWQYGSPPEPCR